MKGKSVKEGAFMGAIDRNPGSSSPESDKQPFPVGGSPLEQVIKDLFTSKIAPHLERKELAVLSETSITMKGKVAPALNQAWAKIKASITVGPKEWNQVGFEVTEASPLPEDIDAILKSDCPYFMGKKVFQTHKLMYIPPGLSINGLGHLMRYLREGEHDTVFDHNSWGRIFQDIGDDQERKGYWVLITTDVIPDSRNRSFADQQKLIKDGYEVPSMIDAIALATMHCQLSGGERLLPRDPWTYTRCQQAIVDYQLVVGAFAPSGLLVRNFFFDSHVLGVCALRKFR